MKPLSTIIAPLTHFHPQVITAMQRSMAFAEFDSLKAGSKKVQKYFSEFRNRLEYQMIAESTRIATSDLRTFKYLPVKVVSSTP